MSVSFVVEPCDENLSDGWKPDHPEGCVVCPSAGLWLFGRKSSFFAILFSSLVVLKHCRMPALLRQSTRLTQVMTPSCKLQSCTADSSPLDPVATRPTF